MYKRCIAEFDFRVIGDGRSAMARYANNSNYRNDSLIRKESKRNRTSTYLMSDLCHQDFIGHIGCWCQLTWVHSVRQRSIDQGNQTNHQRERNCQVRPALLPQDCLSSFLNWSPSCLTDITPTSLSYYREDDTKWPPKNKDGKQELEIRMGNDHISFEVGLSEKKDLSR